MDIIITGRVGIGKTTVCQKILGLARRAGCTCGGILTPKVVDGNTVKGIDVIDIKSGKRETLASLEDVYDGPHIGRYFFKPSGIRFGIRAIENGASSDILMIDEIGYLELQGEGFVNALSLIKTKKVANSILVIRKALLPDFQPQLDRELSVFEVNLNNRNELPQRIYSYLATLCYIPGLTPL